MKNRTFVFLIIGLLLAVLCLFKVVAKSDEIQTFSTNKTLDSFVVYKEFSKKEKAPTKDDLTYSNKGELKRTLGYPIDKGYVDHWKFDKELGTNLKSWEAWAQTQGGLNSSTALLSLTHYFLQEKQKLNTEVESFLNDPTNLTKNYYPYVLKAALFAGLLPTHVKDGEAYTNIDIPLNTAQDIEAWKLVSKNCEICTLALDLQLISPKMLNLLADNYYLAMSSCNAISHFNQYNLKNSENQLSLFLYTANNLTITTNKENVSEDYCVKMWNTVNFNYNNE